LIKRGKEDKKEKKMMKSRRQLKVISVAILMMLFAFAVVPLVSASETTVTISDTNLPEGESTIINQKI